MKNNKKKKKTKIFIEKSRVKNIYNEVEYILEVEMINYVKKKTSTLIPFFLILFTRSVGIMDFVTI